MSDSESGRKSLKSCFGGIKNCESSGNNDMRTQHLYNALSTAKSLGYNCGIEDGPSIFIELPEYGKVSWHCNIISEDDEKYNKITRFYRGRYGNALYDYAKEHDLDIKCEITGWEVLECYPPRTYTFVQLNLGDNELKTTVTAAGDSTILTAYETFYNRLVKDGVL